MKKETAKKAAQWWADQLRGSAKLDAKLDDPMGEGLAYMLQGAEKAKQTPEQVDKFEQELTKVILKQKHIWTIGVDYHPDGILQEAADRAGLALGMTTLPWKTTMWINDDEVKVACGYGASPELL
jgi:hypothetical protein